MQFAKETGDAVPLLIHNLPQATSKLEFDLLRKLIDTGRFAGIKDSSGDWPFFEQLLELRRARPFALFTAMTGPPPVALRAGANGVISGSACAVPELLAGLARAVSSGDEVQADALNTRLMEFHRMGGEVSISHRDQTRGRTARAEIRAAADTSCAGDQAGAGGIFQLVLGLAAPDEESRHTCLNPVISASSAIS